METTTRQLIIIKLVFTILATGATLFFGYSWDYFLVVLITLFFSLWHNDIKTSLTSGGLLLLSSLLFFGDKYDAYQIRFIVYGLIFIILSLIGRLYLLVSQLAWSWLSSFKYQQYWHLALFKLKQLLRLLLTFKGWMLVIKNMFYPAIYYKFLKAVLWKLIVNILAWYPVEWLIAKGTKLFIVNLRKELKACILYIWRLPWLLKLKIVFLAGLPVIILRFIDISLINVLFWEYLFVAIVFRLDSRWSAGVAISGLLSLPIILIYEHDFLAEQVAIVVYYLLVITVVLQIIEYVMVNGRNTVVDKSTGCHVKENVI